jgi:hypothetical protein
MMKNPVTVLVVDDDEVDLMAIERSFRQRHIANDIVAAKDGVEAVAILRGGGGRPPLPRPYVILLDLNMPRMNGIRVPAGDPPGSGAARFDRVRSHHLRIRGGPGRRLRRPTSRASSSSPMPAAAFLATVEMIEHFWRVVEFP